ncbi:protein TPX2-like isoform X2 [Arachis stenosperma]|uniref:protein TPX2-like isoform X2 n=1 Tax=Arachis stenosperma TaxID=217475 RepID=UPI0025AD8185|nr:protein TPX2-like isoform X2 [Arachis stenosperma]
MSMIMKMNTVVTMMEVEEEQEQEQEQEEEEEEEEEGGEEIEHVFIAHEIDLDYEFDAPRFFDFTRPETPAEAQRAELWFQNAPTYPQSPFVAKLVVREGFVLEDASDSLKSKILEFATNVDDEKSSVASAMEFSLTVVDDNNNGSKAHGGILHSDATNHPLELPTGHTFSSKTMSDAVKSKVKSAVPKRSTLMKPTACQLAKQNRSPQNVGLRFQKLLTADGRNLSTSSGAESQAAKRQKLEGGLLCKVNDVKQHTSFVHKAPKRAVTVDHNLSCSKLKLTVPREPDLKTAHRAQRIRSKHAVESEKVIVAAPRFKARPLNKKILDAPILPLPKRSTPRLPEFQKFHLKTCERAMQHSYATSSSSPHCNDSDKGLDRRAAVTTLENRIRHFRRPTAMGTPKYDGLDFTHNLKARPPNKKIPLNKGDNICHFQNSKKETTVPMEFNVYTDKGVQCSPPIELFNKLSLTSEAQPNNGSQLKLPQHSGMCRKEKRYMFGTKPIHNRNGGCISEAGTLLSGRRSLGIR